MNFLAHFIIAEDLRAPLPASPSYIVGNALPDILPLAAPRLRLRPAMLTGQTGEIADGVRIHLATDTSFHRTPAFAEAQSRVRVLIADAGFLEIKVRGFFLAHVLTEMALDAHLARTQPGLLDRYYAGYNGLPAETVTRWACAVTQYPLPGLTDTLTRFGQSQYLRHYLTDTGVAEGLNRLCRRARQDTFEGDNTQRLIALTARTIALIPDMASALMSETARRVAQLTRALPIN